ncbi:MAG: hypothetical protein ACRC2T_04970 [Thermoguttaceae bacterium]
MSTLPKRHGLTLIELFWAIVFLALGCFILSRPSYRAVEIVRAVTGGMQYDSIFAAAAFFLTLFSWLCIVVGIYRLRMRYGDLLYFPLMVGFPLGFALVPFRPFSLPIYGSLLIASLIATPIAFFLLQSMILLFFMAISKRRRNPIPETLPPFTPGYIRHRTKPENIKEGVPHPNRNKAWEDYYNSVGIHKGYALDAYLMDDSVEVFRNQFSTHCQKLLLHYKQATGFIRYWDRETSYLETLIEPFAALDFDGARDWAIFVNATLHANTHILSMRDERLISAMCAAILIDYEELGRLNRELKKPIGWLDRMVARSPMYWDILIAGLAERDVDRCCEAIRIQSEEWYSPVLSNYYRLNVHGVAMTNLCRWRGIPVPALEPIIPESLLFNENTT